MRPFIDQSSKKLIQGKYIFLDNDFLGEVFKDEILFKDSFDFFSDGYPVIDPFTQFEFLRDVFLPEQRILKEKFITKEIFAPYINHQQVFLKLQENAILLSKIYMHQYQGRKNKQKTGPIDLLLASRVMYHSKQSVLVTGNNKHFPSFIFDVLAVINCQESDDSMRSFSIVEFSHDKFTNCYNQLINLENKTNNKLSSK